MDPNHLLDSQLISQIEAKINAAQNIGIISHRSPDPDTIGANLALAQYLRQLGKQVTSICSDRIPQNYQQLPLAQSFQCTPNFADYDLLFTVDCSSAEQAVFEDAAALAINLRHQRTNTLFGQLNVVEILFSSTAELLLTLLRDYWQASITPTMATLLLAGIYYDTGSFMHSNTNDRVFLNAEYLLSSGADLTLISKNLFHSFSLAKLQLWGAAMSSYEVTDQHGKCVIDQQLLQQYGCCTSEISGLMDYLSSATNTPFTLLVSEDKNQIRGSLRTNQNDINLAELAKSFGGGGHKKAAGFTIPGKLHKKQIWSVKRG